MRTVQIVLPNRGGSLSMALSGAMLWGQSRLGKTHGIDVFGNAQPGWRIGQCFAVIVIFSFGSLAKLLCRQKNYCADRKIIRIFDYHN